MMRRAVVAALGLSLGACAEAAPPPSPSPVVQVGLERVESGQAPYLEGKRLGLVAHAASVTHEGRHAIDVFLDRKLELVRIFAPEHGLRGGAEAGQEVEDGIDPASGLPVVSLYGADRAPRTQHLADLDVLVFDLQGGGVRFYTYVSTLILTLEATARDGVELVVLDRPNPLGGDRVEGPLVAPREVVPASFVNRAPGPLVHGLTLGEMARYVNADLNPPSELRVVKMAGWERSMTWRETGRPWVSPSPNLRSPEAALAYPGIALLEGTNVSEGRGTEAPFLRIGAPWLVAEEVSSSAPGFAFAPIVLQPRASPAARSPKYMDQSIPGLSIEVTDPRKAESYRFGLELLFALARQDGFELRDQGRALTWLLGTPTVTEALEQGGEATRLLAADRTAHRRWRAERRGALLY